MASRLLVPSVAMPRCLRRAPLVVTLLVAACDDDGSPPPATDATTDVATACPAVQPDEASTCDEVAVGAAPCTYLIETCPCGPSDIEWTCTCTNGGWTCSRGYDCYPCPDAALAPPP